MTILKNVAAVGLLALMFALALAVVTGVLTTDDVKGWLGR